RACGRESFVRIGHRLCRWTLRLDGLFLILAGGTAMLTEIGGHFFGVGPMAATLGSPYTIGGFEAHGLAIIFAVLMIRAAARTDRGLWHAVGLSVHLLLSSANLLFWTSFVQQDLVVMGVITTVFHVV